MRASLPSNLILQSETIITLNPDKSIENHKLDEFEFMIIEALSLNGQISINDVSEIVGKKYFFINKFNVELKN